MKAEEKTNVMRILYQKKIPYNKYRYGDGTAISGIEVAASLNQNPDLVFKTLVTVGKTKQYYVFVIPVNAELDLKKAASAAGEKSVSMIRQKELLELTGYVHGGCSPIGMKKQFRTFIHETALLYDTVCVSAGKVGFQIELSPEDLISAARCTAASLV